MFSILIFIFVDRLNCRGIEPRRLFSVAVALDDHLWVDSASSAGGGEPFPCCAGIFGKVAGEGGFDWMICGECFHLVAWLVDTRKMADGIKMGRKK
jgi:hypothetical protein